MLINNLTFVKIELNAQSIIPKIESYEQSNIPKIESNQKSILKQKSIFLQIKSHKFH